MKGKIRVLMGKTALDAHWRGPMVVGMALRDAGMEVIWCGMHMAKEIAAIAIEEDVDVIGLHIGGRYQALSDLIEILDQEGVKGQVLIVCGGTVPQEDIPKLKALGVGEVFPPGSSLSSIVDYVATHVKTKEKV